MAHREPARLSGGERQRVAIARALANSPAILLADEPTGSLDRDAATLVLDMFEALHRDQGTTLVLVTHDSAVAARAQRHVRLADGKLTSQRDQRPYEERDTAPNVGL
jgi:predicted ABC-type transport system involved in lysophospholipase L1 biosynthesis ATPase subunit